MSGVDFGSVLDESAELLIQDTPPDSVLSGYAEKVHEEYLRGVRFKLQNANLEDSRAFIEEVLANTAEAQGHRATTADVKHWSTLSFEELSNSTDSAGKRLDDLAVGVSVSSASAGLQVAGDVYNESLGFYSLSSGALEDGSISVPEAVQLGASASSFASTMMSSVGTGGVALGPIGAIAGLVLGGISFLASGPSAWEAYRQAAIARATAQANQEKVVIDAFLAEERRKFEQWRENVVWRARDTAISEVADAWNAFEDGMGVRFGVRYFPGSSTPPRAGTYRSTRIEAMGGVYLSKYRGGTGGVPFECDALSGCLYFPEPHPQTVAVYGYRAAYVAMLEEMAKRDRYLTTTPANLKNEKDYVPSRVQDYPQYAYYTKTFRAFDAFLVNNSTKEKRRFWVTPGERIETLNWKTYEDLAYEWLCGNSSACSAFDTCTNDISCAYSPSQRQKGFEAMVAAYSTKGAHDPKVRDRAIRFVEAMQDKLENEVVSANIIKTRVMGDLIQTANAVGGEMATSIRLQEVLWAPDGGYMRTGIERVTDLSPQDQRMVTPLDQQTLSAIERQESRDRLINNTLLAAGVASFGYGAYSKWGKRG